MKEVLINKYLKIEPVEQTGFISQVKDSYEEIGVVIAKDDSLTNIPLGSRVYFDSYMAKKYPIAGEIGKFQWYIHIDEVVKYEYADA